MSGQEITAAVPASSALNGRTILGVFKKTVREGGSSCDTLHFLLDSNVELVIGSQFVLGADHGGYTVATVWMKTGEHGPNDRGEVLFRE